MISPDVTAIIINSPPVVPAISFFHPSSILPCLFSLSMKLPKCHCHNANTVITADDTSLRATGKPAQWGIFRRRVS